MLDIISRYGRSAFIRALVQLIPMSIGSAADTALITRVQAIRAERARVFFDELATGTQELCPELLENNDFLHCYFATATAALRTHRSQKIQAFARLLKSSTLDGNIDLIDEYEEFLAILDDLSRRELQVLVWLSDFEELHPAEEDENDLQRTSRYWDQFIQKLENELSIRPAEADSILIRLNRTGCYETFTGGYWDYTGGKGKTTALFRRLKELVLRDES